MNLFNKTSYEIKRIFKEPITLFFMGTNILAVIWFCLNSLGETATDLFILEPAKNSAIFGSLIFTLLTLLQFHRDYKNNTDKIILTSTDPIFFQIERTLAIVFIAIVTVFIATLFTLPYSIIKTGNYFQMDTFAVAWYLIFLGALIISVLLSAGFYMIFRRIESSFVAMACLIFLSKIFEYQEDLNPSYLLFWVQTNASEFSDLVTNQFQIDMILWNRIFSMSIALTIWSFGLCSLRCYEQGILKSFIVNVKRSWCGISFVILIILSSLSYIYEPVFDDSTLLVSTADYDSGTGLVSDSSEEQASNEELILIERNAEVDVDSDNRRLIGETTYIFNNPTAKEQILPLLINTGYTIKSAFVNGKSADVIRYSTADRISATEENHATWYINLPSDEEITVEIRYQGRPKNKGVIIQEARNGISEEYIDLTSISVCPWPYTEISEDFVCSINLSLDENLTPVFIQGEPEIIGTVNGKNHWNYSGPFLGFIAADYYTKVFEAGGITVFFKYFEKHNEEITDMGTENIIKASIDYFTEVYGPLNYEDHLIVLELPAIYSGGYASGNMSAIDETNFTGDIGTVVHEIAHQWWGLGTYPVTDDVSYWSAEGITCYSTYCFMKKLFWRRIWKGKFH